MSASNQTFAIVRTVPSGPAGRAQPAGGAGGVLLLFGATPSLSSCSTTRPSRWRGKVERSGGGGSPRGFPFGPNGDSLSAGLDRGLSKGAAATGNRSAAPAPPVAPAVDCTLPHRPRAVPTDGGLISGPPFGGWRVSATTALGGSAQSRERRTHQRVFLGLRGRGWVPVRLLPYRSVPAGLRCPPAACPRLTAIIRASTPASSGPR